MLQRTGSFSKLEAVHPSAIMQETASWRASAVYRMKTQPVRDLEMGRSLQSAEYIVAGHQ